MNIVAQRIVFNLGPTFYIPATHTLSVSTVTKPDYKLELELAMYSSEYFNLGPAFCNMLYACHGNSRIGEKNHTTEKD